MGVGDVLGIQDKKKSVFRDNFVFFQLHHEKEGDKEEDKFCDSEHHKIYLDVLNMSGL